MKNKNNDLNRDADHGMSRKSSFVKIEEMIQDNDNDYEDNESFFDVDENMSIFQESVISDFQAVDSSDYSNNRKGFLQNYDISKWKNTLLKISRKGIMGINSQDQIEIR